jgi:hypothetical protein
MRTNVYLRLTIIKKGEEKLGEKMYKLFSRKKVSWVRFVKSDFSVYLYNRPDPTPKLFS